jgi:hypothetical protein
MRIGGGTSPDGQRDFGFPAKMVPPMRRTRRRIVRAEEATTVTETSSEFAAHLAAELGACVHLPATPAYRTALDGVYFPEASRRIPL